MVLIIQGQLQYLSHGPGGQCVAFVQNFQNVGNSLYVFRDRVLVKPVIEQQGPFF